SLVLIELVQKMLFLPLADAGLWVRSNVSTIHSTCTRAELGPAGEPLGRDNLSFLRHGMAFNASPNCRKVFTILQAVVSIWRWNAACRLWNALDEEGDGEVDFCLGQAALEGRQNT